MRKFSKYKIFNISRNLIKKIPLRILKFRRPKWVFLQKSLTRKNKQRQLINPFLIKNSYKSWERVKKYYKKGLQNKNLLYSIYNNSIKFKTLKKKISKKALKKEIILNYLIKPQYKIDILLWNLYFFSSIYHARQKISNKQVLVNNLSVKSNTFLQKGDIITFKSWNKKNDLFFNRFLKKYSLNEKFFPFLEVDYYTKTIIIIKNFDELSFEDLQILITDFVHLKSLSYNIK